MKLLQRFLIHYLKFTQMTNHSYYDNIGDIIGNTPILKLNTLYPQNSVYAKLEFYNPSFSIKDRAALYMLEAAIAQNRIQENGYIIEATSGNTGLGLCVATKKYNLKVICVLSDDTSYEKIEMLKAYGAKVILCDAKLNSNEIGGYVWVAKMLAKYLPNSFLVNQFVNPDNPRSHYQTTAPEIWNQLNGNIDIFFSTIGTGGTISGIGKYLKEKNPNIKIIAIEPIGGIYRNTSVNEKAVPKDHLIHSISDNFISPNLDFSVIDQIIEVKDKLAFDKCFEALSKEKICIGTSSGLVLAGIDFYIKKYKVPPNKRIVTIMPDNGLKYTNSLFNSDFLNTEKIKVNFSNHDGLNNKICKLFSKNNFTFKII
ncbi:cystathionine beta-synthase [Elizabethkingia anophelis]|nr:cystathionine beta-synthase [Elizabethkingia anophelis]